MSVGTLDLWHWLALVQHELLLFAGVFFLIGAFDDLLVDGLWLWFKARGRAPTERRSRAGLQALEPERPVAVLIPAWRETAVIGATIRHLLTSWPQERLRLYVGCYRGDPATLAAAVAAARGDERLRLVIHGAEGPTTKADCLNRLYQALVIDEARSGVRFGFVVFHDAEDMVDPGALGLIAETIEAGADFVQLPVVPLVPGRESGWDGAPSGRALLRGICRGSWQGAGLARCPGGGGAGGGRGLRGQARGARSARRAAG
ncbi:MAG: hypothetical protein KatS3mg120_1274 [Erythrobacter sp.]|nr:MAG: hypothetical protein KatS3mg120_1274 [Erythrobacter sp.]